MVNRVAVAAALVLVGCGGSGSSGADTSGGKGNGNGSGSGTPSCSAFSAAACTQGTFGSSHSVSISSAHSLLSVDGVSCTFSQPHANMNAGACGDYYDCGGTSRVLAWAPEGVTSTTYRWTVDNMYVTCSGGGGGGCAGKCSSCLSSCRGYSGCCCGSGCICESDCTSSCGDNC